MRWPQDADGWPLAEHSRFVLSRPHRWHVQEAGTGPLVLLLHGAGGATQSWRGVFPALAQDHRVVAVDLPGQGLSQLGARMRCGLDPMAADLKALIAREGWQPDAIVGHSAGAALALRLTEDMPNPPAVVGINAALDRFEGVAGWLFPLMAKTLAMVPFTADVFARTADNPQTIKRLIEGTGSTLPPEGLALYRRLVADRDHVDATLAMMSQWSVDDLVARLPGHRARTLFITGAGDRAVPPHVSSRAANAMPQATLQEVPDLGHLLHEEDPGLAVRLITAFLGTR